MHASKRTRIAAHAAEIVIALSLLAWFGYPLLDASTRAASPGFLAWKVFPVAAERGPAFWLLAGVSWLLPALALWKLVAPALRGRLSMAAAETPSALLLSSALSALPVFLQGARVATLANGAAWFSAEPWTNWLASGGALVANAVYLALSIDAMSRQRADYAEYLAFQRSSGRARSTLLAVVAKGGIQRRLSLVFTAFIFMVIVALSGFLLRDFGSTLLAAVDDKGTSLAGRAASVVKSALGDRIAMEDFFSIEAAKNEEASIPFERLDWWRKSPRGEAFVVDSSTSSAYVGTEEPMPGYELANAVSIDGSREGFMEFRAPVSLSGRFLGFVSVVYSREVILEPLFRARVRTLMVAALFLYASVFMTFLIGRTIVFPILFLRMSVSTIAGKLGAMVKGDDRLSASALEYQDRVSSKDEIKELSLEIGNMTQVIRGVIPYISASTLKHAERAKPMNERRDLCYLFTDIRGFTSICEGREPEEVVALLNHYLDIQASAIIDAGGDIDKFVGDEVMAVFDGTDKELRACRAAFQIRTAMAEEQEKARRESSVLIEIGIGINSGPVIFGSVGARDRMDFTSIGDTVNLAARLEGANKTYGTKCLVTEAVKEKVEADWLLREIDMLTVKGKTQPVRIYEAIQEHAKSTPKLEKLRSAFGTGLRAYRARKWDVAEKAFGALAEAYDDGPSKAFLRRIEVYRKSPPPEAWNGVFEMKVK